MKKNREIVHHIARRPDKKTKQEQQLTRSINELDTKASYAATPLWTSP